VYTAPTVDAEAAQWTFAGSDLGHRYPATASTSENAWERGHFPSDDAVIKLLWLAIRDIEDKQARQRTKEAGAPRGQRKAPGRLVEGATAHGSNATLGALAIAFPDRT
jgi:putative transposase